MLRQFKLWHLFALIFLVALVFAAYRAGYQHCCEDWQSRFETQE